MTSTLVMSVLSLRRLVMISMVWWLTIGVIRWIIVRMLSWVMLRMLSVPVHWRGHSTVHMHFAMLNWVVRGIFWDWRALFFAIFFLIFLVYWVHTVHLVCFAFIILLILCRKLLPGT